VPDYGAGDAVEVGGPAAAGRELVRGAVQRGGAGCAGVLDIIVSDWGGRKGKLGGVMVVIMVRGRL
jgi:hypothetical protein